MGQSVRRRMRHLPEFAPFSGMSGRGSLTETMNADSPIDPDSRDVYEKPLVLQPGEGKSR